MMLCVATTYIRPFPGDNPRLPESLMKYLWGECPRIIAGVDTLKIRLFVDSVTLDFSGDPYKTKVLFWGNILIPEVSLDFPFKGEFVLLQPKMPRPGRLAKHIVEVIHYRYNEVCEEIGRATKVMPTLSAIRDPSEPKPEE